MAVCGEVMSSAKTRWKIRKYARRGDRGGSRPPRDENKIKVDTLANIRLCFVTRVLVLIIVSVLLVII